MVSWSLLPSDAQVQHSFSAKKTVWRKKNSASEREEKWKRKRKTGLVACSFFMVEKEKNQNLRKQHNHNNSRHWTLRERALTMLSSCTFNSKKHEKTSLHLAYARLHKHKINVECCSDHDQCCNASMLHVAVREREWSWQQRALIAANIQFTFISLWIKTRNLHDRVNNWDFTQNKRYLCKRKKSKLKEKKNTRKRTCEIK